jgi:hypothetical protein
VTARLVDETSNPKENPMAETRWTAPKSGWYQYDSRVGQDPVFIGVEPPEDVRAVMLFAGQDAPEWKAITFESDPAPDA